MTPEEYFKRAKFIWTNFCILKREHSKKSKMKYYALEFDDNFNCLIDEQIPSEFDGISMNLGTRFNRLPLITLVSDKPTLPDCIPNHRRYLFFNLKILNILEQFEFNNFQKFDLIIKDINGLRINSIHKLINITKVVSCIDRDHSILQIDEDEEDDDLNIVDIKSLKLDQNKTENSLIFRLGGFETLLLFREDIAQAIVNARCTGIQFFDSEGYSI
jgi:hypothetical protein